MQKGNRASKKLTRAQRLTRAQFERACDRGLGLVACEQWFSQQVEEVGGHLLWRGDVDREGRPLWKGFTGKLRVPASPEVWWRINDALPAGDLSPICGEQLCVEPEHQAVRSAP